MSPNSSPSKPRRRHIPYRDSKLTFVLSNCIGGNAKTHIVTTVDPRVEAFECTLATLRFSQRAKQVKNHPVAVESSSYLKASSGELRQLVDRLAQRTQFDEVRRKYQSTLVSTSAQTGDYNIIENLKKENSHLVGRVQQLEDQVRDLKYAVAMARQEVIHATAARDAAGKEAQKTQLLRLAEESAQETATLQLQDAVATAVREKERYRARRDAEGQQLQKQVAAASVALVMLEEQSAKQVEDAQAALARATSELTDEKKQRVEMESRAHENILRVESEMESQIQDAMQVGEAHLPSKCGVCIRNTKCLFVDDFCTAALLFAGIETPASTSREVTARSS